MTTWLKTNKIPKLFVALWGMSCSGCQNGFTGIPNLTSLNNPTRVPAPPPGSFQVPPNYAEPTNSNTTAPRSTTLGQLRSLESGRPVGEKIGADGFVASEVTNGSFTSKPVVAQSVSTLQSSANQFNRSIEAASAVFASETGMNPMRAAEPNAIQSDSTELNTDGEGPAVIQAAAMKELPDPRFNEASHASLSSDEGVKWKSPQR